ncbi:MAG: hypothetical protein ACOYNY_19270 [Caldilineaceae bacterium]
MHTIQRIWKDLQQFENLDSYITVTVAVGMAVLNLIGISLGTYIAPLTLAVLGLLAFTSLINRHHIDELRQAFTRSASEFFMEEFPSDMKNNFETATEIWLVGVSLHRTIHFNYEKIERKLRQGHKFKVLLVHPEGPAVEMAVMRNYARKEVAAKSAGIRTVLQLLCDLQQIAPGQFEVRTIQNPLTYGVVAIDPDAASGVLYLEHYPFGVSTESLPKFVMRASDGKWYDFFKREIQAIWNYGVVWQCTTDKIVDEH